jgi:ribosomal protein L44E
MQMKTSTYSRRSKTVSTVRKSQASVVAACWRRNERQSSGHAGVPAERRPL